MERSRGYRTLCGSTIGFSGGHIRFDYVHEIGRNLIHGSDAPETAKSEIALWFKPEELASYHRAGHEWVHEKR